MHYLIVTWREKDPILGDLRTVTKEPSLIAAQEAAAVLSNTSKDKPVKIEILPAMKYRSNQ